MPTYPIMKSSRHLEAHLLDAHSESVSEIPREVRTLDQLRRWHSEAHDAGRSRFAHEHDPADLPEPTDALEAGLLGR